MTKYIYTGPAADYPTLGFSVAGTGSIIDGTLSTPELVLPPDARWAVYGGGLAETGITRYSSGTGVTPTAEPTDGFVLRYSDADNAYVATSPDEFVGLPALDAAIGDAVSVAVDTELDTTLDTRSAALIANPASATATGLSDTIGAQAAPKKFGRDPLYPPAKIVWPIPAHPAPPKVTMTAANPSFPQTQIIPLPDSRVLVTGTQLKTVGSYQQPGHLSTADNFTIPPYGIEFWTDTNIVRLVFAGFGFNYRLVIDGRWAHGASELAAYTVNADGGDHHILLEFTTRKVRHIRFEMQGPVKSVIVPADATVWRPKTPDVRAICVGDSFTLDNVSSDQSVSRLTPYPVALGKLMGWDTWASGVGGSGYLATGGGSVVKFRDRLAADVVPFAPDVVVWAGGHNDGGFTGAQVAAEARLCWDYVAANVPGVRQVVLSPFSQFATVAPSREAVRAALAAEAASAGLPFIDVLSPNIWSGTGKRGATTGDGNSDYYVNTDGVHPTPDGLGGGGTYIAVRAAQLIQNILQEVA